MKALLIGLFSVMILSNVALADSRPATPAESVTLASAVLKDPMVAAAVKQNHGWGARCTHEVTSAKRWENGIDGYDFEMRVDCNLPDGPEVGGGSTMYFIKGVYSDKSVILDSIKIDRAD